MTLPKFAPWAKAVLAAGFALGIACFVLAWSMTPAKAAGAPPPNQQQALAPFCDTRHLAEELVLLKIEKSADAVEAINFRHRKPVCLMGLVSFTVEHVWYTMIGNQTFKIQKVKIKAVYIKRGIWEKALDAPERYLIIPVPGYII